jgi:hypothetical protein
LSGVGHSFYRGREAGGDDPMDGAPRRLAFGDDRQEPRKRFSDLGRAAGPVPVVLDEIQRGPPLVQGETRLSPPSAVKPALT